MKLKIFFVVTILLTSFYTATAHEFLIKSDKDNVVKEEKITIDVVETHVFIKPEELPEGWGLYHYKNNKFYKIKDSRYFNQGSAASAIYKHTVELLTNHIICEKQNIVFAKRVLENRERYKNKQ